MLDPLKINDDLIIPASDLTWRSVRASGPGGQHVNKVATKVELRFDLAHTTALSESAKQRLRRLAKSRVDAKGRLLVTSAKTRDRSRNLVDACDKLAEMIRRGLVAPKPRRPTKPSAGAKARRLAQKRQLSEKKRARRRTHDDD